MSRRETIDITPTWKDLLPAMIAIMQDGSPEGQRTTMTQLTRMAEAADRWNEHMKAVHERNKRYGD